MAAPQVIIPPAIQLALIRMKPGTYGISYDIYTAKTEKNLPEGWNAPRAATYHQLAISLKRGNFRRFQYSDWMRRNTTALTTYWIMIALRQIPPLGKLESTLKGMKMHRIDDVIYDATPDLQLGGRYATLLQGPTPSRLVPPTMGGNVPQPGNFIIPAYTRPSQAAANVAHWRV